ncbi:MAG: hypothetical protein ABIS45_17970 [Burkholderiales bacterium]
MSESVHNDTGHDPELTAIYRAAPADAPPPALDAAILAAARREVSARPRPAGFTFRSLRAPLSIAAVLLLSVSLVTLMREEAPEITGPPRVDLPSAESSKLKVDRHANDPAESASVREEQRPKNLGLKPPQSATASGLGVRGSQFAESMPRSNKDAVAAKPEADAAPPMAFAKRREAAQDVDELRDKKAAVSKQAAASVERQGNAAEPETRRAFSQPPAAAAPSKEMAAGMAQPAAPAVSAVVAGAPAENKTQAGSTGAAADRVEPAPRLRAQSGDAPVRQLGEAPSTFAPSPPQAKPSAPAAAPVPALGKLERSADLAPGKWLEHIEELRKQGRLDEARVSLLEFRKRYPDYRLPYSLSDLAKP